MEAVASARRTAAPGTTPTPTWVLGLTLLAALLLGPVPAAHSEDEAPGASVTAQAQGFLSVVEHDGAPAAFERVHAQDVDPWVLAEELLLLGRTEVAQGLTEAGLSSDQQALAAYLGRAPVPDAALAARVLDAATALAAGDAAGALERLGETATTNLTVTEVRALGVRADTLQKLGKEPEVREALERLATCATVIGWRRAAMEAQIRLLARLDARREPAAVRRILASLLALDADARDLGRSATWCALLGQLERDRGALRTSRRWLLESEGLYDVLARGPGLAPALAKNRFAALRTLADVQLDLGNTAAGVEAAFRAQDVSQHMAPGVRIEALVQLAQVFHVLGRLEQGEAYLQEAFDLAGEMPKELRARLKGDRARLMLELGRVAAARNLYDEVRAALQETSDLRMRFVARLHFAGMWLDVGPAQRDTAGLQRALLDLLEVQRDLEDAPADFGARAELEINAKLMSARALNLLGRAREALPLLRELVEAGYVRDAPGLMRYARRELAHALRQAGRPQESYEITTQALAELSAEVEGLSADFALSLLSPPQVRELIEEHLAGALALGDGARLVEALERTHGMAFLSELQRRQRAGAGQQGGANVSMAGALAADVARAAQAYWQVLPQRNLKVTAQARDALWEIRRQLRAAQDREEFEAARAVPTNLAPEEGPLFRRPEALEADEAMLYFAATADAWIAVLVHGEATQVVPLGRRDELAPLLAAARETWLDDNAQPKHAAALQGMVDMLVPAPLREALTRTPADAPRVTHVYVSASDVLAHVPWSIVLAEALTRAGAKPDTLPTVSLMASQEVLRRVRLWSRAAGKGPLLAVGDPDYTTGGVRPVRVAIFGRALQPLPESGAEAKALVDERRGDLLLVRGQASLAMVRRCLFDAPYPFDVLHLSCHGILYGAAAWSSALALHPTPGNDGLLTADEVTRWRMPHGPRLVVMAACESGLGTPVAGEGEEGLVRAFLLAGARHVVASLWKVPDATSRDVMIAFHRLRRERGLAPAAALRAAQAEVRAAAKPGAELTPHQWAGWAVWGPRD